MASLRQQAHDWSLVFFAVLGSYLLWVVAAAPLAVVVTKLVASWQSGWGRALLGFMTLDLTKLPVLLLASWIMVVVVGLSPGRLATGLVGGVFLLEFLVAGILGQGRWLLADPVALLLRLATLVATEEVCRRFIRWRRARGQTRP